MFCEKCGAQLPDTAKFCNKCGNTLRKKVNNIRMSITKVQNYVTNRMTRTSVSEKRNRGLLGILLVVVILAIAVVIFGGINKKKTNIYGTWADANKIMTLTFAKDGNLRISGATNVLGADIFQFTEEDGVLHLQAQGVVGNSVELDIEYEISDDTLKMSILGQKIILNRVTDSDGTGNVVEDFVEDTLDMVQIYSLYGTWSDSNDAVCFTFQEDGKLRISGLEDTLGVDVFTFSEVDSDTLKLK
ncbi:MAG: zinc-ribbon domain-containing protein, partial [Bariatricus sp.]